MAAPTLPPPLRLWSTLRGWLDTDYLLARRQEKETVVKKVELAGLMPFIFMHGGCLAVFLVGWSPVAIGTAVFLYFLRMFAITGFYHRYFSHRTFKTSRLLQFIFGVVGMMAVQKGPLWWAAHHRWHHRMSDTEQDIHSPLQSGFWWSHIGWITSTANLTTDYKAVSDLAKYPELVFMNRFDWLIPAVFAGVLFMLGNAMQAFWPGLGTNGWQLLVWGFFISTCVLYHCTFTINSLSHQFGSRRYNTTDTSRNNFFLALLTMGEGWHNNHHRFQGSVRQGFYWWEIDMTYYILKVMSWLGLIYDLNPVPERAYEEA